MLSRSEASRIIETCEGYFTAAQHDMSCSFWNALGNNSHQIMFRGEPTMTGELRNAAPNGTDDMYDVIIIGAGPTGLFASFYAGMRGMRTLILDALPEPGGQVAVLYPEKFIYDIPGFPKIIGRDLVKGLLEQAMTFHPDLHLEEQVQNLTVHGERDIELTTTRASYRTRSVLITAGVGAFSPNKLDA